MSSASEKLQSSITALLARLSPRVLDLFQVNTQSRLLKSVDTVLLVFDERLYDLSNCAWRSLAPAAEQTSAQRIAQAASELLGAAANKSNVLLLLPPQEFIATQVSMPGVSRESLRSALHLQSAVVLPSYEQELVFCVHTKPAASRTSDLVLWSDAGKIDALFCAFAERALFLAGVMPRTLAATALAEPGAAVFLHDADSTGMHALLYQDGVASDYLQSNHADLEAEEFQRQWQDAIEAAEAEASVVLELRSAQDYYDLGIVASSAWEYCFVPDGAQQALKHAEKGKRIVYAGVAAVVLVLLASAPLLLQSLQIMRLQAQLTSLESESAQARADQAVVREFEQSWGVLNEFPQQNISQVLLQLQSVLSPGVLTSIEIDEGNVEIEGESPDPQRILQLLEQDPLFTGVDFARATNNERYYIELRLSTVDYEAYRQWYFPDVRR